MEKATTNARRDARLVAALMAVVLIPLSGPLFFCKCKGQVVSVSEFTVGPECCAEECATDRPGSCPDQCMDPVPVLFAKPEGAGLRTPTPTLSVPPFSPGLWPNPALASANLPHPRLGQAEELRLRRTCGLPRLHLHLQIFLI